MSFRQLPCQQLQLAHLSILSFAGMLTALSAGEAWVARYDGPAGLSDQPSAITVDQEGSIYICGQSYVRTGPFSNWVTIKYNPAGTQQWATQYDGGTQERATAIEVSKDGTSFVTGTSKAKGGTFDYATVRYDRLGRELWSSRYDGEGRQTDQANAIAIDIRESSRPGSSPNPTGNVYVTGRAFEFGTKDCVTIKYDCGGNELWVLSYDNGFDDEGIAISVNRVGDVYIGGSSVGSSGDTDFFLLKVSPSGIVIWEERFDTGSEDEFATLVLDDVSGIIVTGSSGEQRYSTIRYDWRGTREWIRFQEWPEYPLGSVWANGLVIDRDGNVYVTGRPGTIKYSQDGAALWSAMLPVCCRGADSTAVGLGVDRRANVYVSSRKTELSNGWVYATRKYNPDGELLWLQTYEGGRVQDKQNTPKALAVDSECVYVTGLVKVDERSQTDIVTVKYDDGLVEAKQGFIRGDCDGDGQVAGTVTDAVFLLLYSFRGGRTPDCIVACDANGDGRTVGDTSDAVYLLRFNFQAGPPPVAPFPDCGDIRKVVGLDCERGTCVAQ